MKLQSIVINEKSEADQNVHDVISLVKNAKSANEIRQNTRGFALENDDGSIVKVFVRADQADDFEHALAKELYDADEEGIEIPEVLFNLRQHFEIVDVEWGAKSIPEDEEEIKKPKKDDDLPPPDEEEGGEDEGRLPPPPGGEDDLPPPDDDGGMPPADDGMGMPADLGGGESQTDLLGAITQVMDMLKAKAEADKAEADAKKAEAEAKIASEANKAASLRAAQEEEILDMEDYNKKQDANKKMADTRDKLIKYRHELKNSNQSSTDLGESMNVQPNTKKFPDATPEEEEVLDMERWEKKKKEREQAKKTRERLIKFRHARKHAKKKGFKQAVEGLEGVDIEKIRSVTFGKFNTLVEQQLQENLPEPPKAAGVNTSNVAKQIFEKMKAHPQFKGYVACNFQQIENIVNQVLGEKVKSDSDRKHVAVEVYGMLQDVKERHK